MIRELSLIFKEESKAYGVKLRSGIKPSAIDSLSSLAIKSELNACGIDSLRKMEYAFTQQILTFNKKGLFIIDEIKDFTWTPIIWTSFIKTDVLNKKLLECMPISGKPVNGNQTSLKDVPLIKKTP